MTEEKTTEEMTDEERSDLLYMQLNAHMAMCNGMNMADILRLTSAMNIDVILQIAERHGVDTAKKMVSVYEDYHKATLAKMSMVITRIEAKQSMTEEEGETELDLSDREVFDPPSGVQ